MRVALFTSFKANKKEPVADLLGRVHGAFVASGPAPFLQFVLNDAPVPGFVSSVDRVLKRFPALADFLREAPVSPAGPPVRHLSNRESGQPLGFSTLEAIAQGIPRSFPFHNAQFVLARDDFGMRGGPLGSVALPGVVIGDGWWVNGRIRSVSATTIVEAGDSQAKIPEPPASVAAVLEACGKVDTRTQLPLAEETSAVPQMAMFRRTDAAAAIGEVIRDFRSRLDQLVTEANLPHDLPPPVRGLVVAAPATGPKKKVILEVFGPMGFDCRAGSGTYELRRRTERNLTVEVSLDVGTWSRSLTASFHVYGLGFSAMLPLPVAPGIPPIQYPIGDAENWRQLVENLGALVRHLEATFVPAVETAAGPSPAWYRPES